MYYYKLLVCMLLFLTCMLMFVTASTSLSLIFSRIRGDALVATSVSSRFFWMFLLGLDDLLCSDNGLVTYPDLVDLEERLEKEQVPLGIFSFATIQILYIIPGTRYPCHFATNKNMTSYGTAKTWKASGAGMTPLPPSPEIKPASSQISAARTLSLMDCAWRSCL